MIRKVILVSLLAVMLLSVHAQSHYSFGVRIVGKGKPMILIPGLKGSADTYNEVVAHYKDRYKCYVIALAGFAGQPASGELDHPFREQRDELIKVNIPLWKYKAAVTKSKYKDRGIIPDYPLTPSISDILQKKDVQMELALKLAGKE